MLSRCTQFACGAGLGRDLDQPELRVGPWRGGRLILRVGVGAKVLPRVGGADEIVVQLASATRIAATGSSTERLVPRVLGAATGRVLLVVDDPDSVFAQAVAADAVCKSAVDEQYGWRVGRVIDPFGHESESPNRSLPGRHRRQRLSSGSVIGANDWWA
jgi:PhnB protein